MPLPNHPDFHAEIQMGIDNPNPSETNPSGTIEMTFPSTSEAVTETCPECPDYLKPVLEELLALKSQSETDPNKRVSAQRSLYSFSQDENIDPGMRKLLEEISNAVDSQLDSARKEKKGSPEKSRYMFMEVSSEQWNRVQELLRVKQKFNGAEIPTTSPLGKAAKETFESLKHVMPAEEGSPENAERYYVMRNRLSGRSESFGEDKLGKEISSFLTECQKTLEEKYDPINKPRGTYNHLFLEPEVITEFLDLLRKKQASLKPEETIEDYFLHQEIQSVLDKA